MSRGVCVKCGLEKDFFNWMGDLPARYYHVSGEKMDKTRTVNRIMSKEVIVANDKYLAKVY